MLDRLAQLVEYFAATIGDKTHLAYEPSPIGIG
jgi:hypothetical protein